MRTVIFGLSLLYIQKSVQPGDVGDELAYRDTLQLMHSLPLTYEGIDGVSG